MSAETVAFIGALTYQNRELLPVLQEQLADNDDQVLPHLVMADVVRWLVVHRSDEEVVRSIIDWLERAYERGDDDVRDVIAVSGVEMIPDPGQPGAELRTYLGPQLSTVDPWPA
ncbi:hypothetical protein JQN72_01285 [Phycicoccus sp. CSK15P-2]|uniref:DUF7674 family protein n=1 Tax=Phycicoccus sp. CSK15P-2 TaxID=2807627 RepID=UPI001951042F|nr:hypothetical protein [Phycicoccus sp. CSK15P-2]MBM6402879.1 hypothetical protein [Phycicoccus sp. CSK15P-2]